MGSHRQVTTLGDVGVTPARTTSIHRLIETLVRRGAALGWLEAPGYDEVRDLLAELAAQENRGDATTVLVLEGDAVLGFGCWRRYDRPTHRPQADVPWLMVDSRRHGAGLGGVILDRLIATARTAEIEQLTLDSRGDNTRAHHLWRSRGFVEYGRLADFVAVGPERYDKTLWVLDLR